MNDGPAINPDWRIFAFGSYLILLNLTLLYVLLRIWPVQIPLGTADQVSLLWGGRLSFALPLETRYLLIAAVAGALGGYIHLATSFADYVGNRRLVWSWGWWFVLRPFIGMALAVVLYFVLRAGLLTGTSGAEGMSPYGVAAVAGLAGMFSRQATDKLREVFEDLFRTQKPQERSDKLEG